MTEKTFEQARSELIELAVGAHEYESITTWEELAEGVAFEMVAVSQRENRLAVLLKEAEKQSEREFVAEMTVTCGHFNK